MENISKALMIAGGILITIMVTSLIIVFWNTLSGYFTEEHNATITEQNAEFNAQFENYNGKTIKGNELISVMNKIVNYNRTASDLENFDRIIIRINLNGKQTDFIYKGSGESIFSGVISNGIISNNNGNDNGLEEISNMSSTLSNELDCTDTQLQRLSANISNIVDINTANNNELNKRAETLKSILGKSNLSDTEISEIEEATSQYYQYTQFKRARFRCTNIEHNTTNGRVNLMEFEIQ